MDDDESLQAWFCQEVLPLERALMDFIRRNWPNASDVIDLRQDIYERVLMGARGERPRNVGGYVFTVARNHLINRSRRSRIIRFDLVADLDAVTSLGADFHSDRQLIARDELRRAHAALDALPPRCREVVRLRKVEGLSTRETACRMGITVDTVEKQLSLGMRAMTDFMLGGSGKITRPAEPGAMSKTS